jgi:hypothetical protein
MVPPEAPHLVEGAKLLLPSPGTCGVLLRKVNGTAIIQLPSKRQMQVCMWLQVGGIGKGGIFGMYLSCQGQLLVFYMLGVASSWICPVPLD